MQHTGKLNQQQFWALIDRREEQMRNTAGELPLYGVAPWAGLRMAGTWEWRNGQLANVVLVHGDPDCVDGDVPYAHVQTTIDNPTTVAADIRRTRLFTDEHESSSRVEISVDGQPREFDYWRGASGWCAAVCHDGYGLVVEGGALTPAQIRLVHVTDIDPYLAGRRAYLRKQRGEE